MHRRIWMAVLALLLLAAAGIGWRSFVTAPEQPAAVDSASLGLLLLDAEGSVYVLAVSDRSQADQAGLEPGDCILSAGEKQLPDTAAFNELLQMNRDQLLLTIRRDDRELRLTLPCR